MAESTELIYPVGFDFTDSEVNMKGRITEPKQCLVFNKWIWILKCLFVLTCLFIWLQCAHTPFAQCEGPRSLPVLHFLTLFYSASDTYINAPG